MVNDQINQRFAGLLIDLMQHFGGDFDQVRVKFGLVPFLEHVTDLSRGHAKAATHQIVAFSDELHIGVFDAIVHHLDEVAGTVKSDMGDARLAFGLCCDGFENRLQRLPGFFGASRHHGRSKQSAFLTTGHAASDEMQAASADFLLTTNGVWEVGVACVDNDVSRFHQVGERVDHGVGRLSGLDHDDGGTWLDETVHELFEGFRREEFAFAAVLVHELFGTTVGTVEHGHFVAVVCEVTCEATAHCGKTDYADVCFS